MSVSVVPAAVAVRVAEVQSADQFGSPVLGVPRTVVVRSPLDSSTTVAVSGTKPVKLMSALYGEVELVNVTVPESPEPESG